MQQPAAPAHRALRIARRAFTPLALAGLVVAVYSSRGVAGEILAQARLGPLLATLVIWSSLHLAVPLMAWIVLRGLGVEVSYRTALRIHMLRLPARYLPGGIWQTVSRMVDLHALGVGRPQLSVLVAMENVAPLGMALLAGCACLWLDGGSALPLSAIAAAGAVIVVALPWALRRALPTAPLPLRHYLAGLCASLVFWLGAGTAFVVYWSALPSAPLDGTTMTLAGTYLLAWAAGFLAVFAPQGIGVFEVVAGLLLEGQLPLAGMALLVAGFRAMTLGGDALAYAAAQAHRWTFAGRSGSMH